MSDNATFGIPEPESAAYATSPGRTSGGAYSSQAQSFSVSFDRFHNEIPEGSEGSPKYDGDQYAGTVDRGHPKNG